MDLDWGGYVSRKTRILVLFQKSSIQKSRACGGHLSHPAPRAFPEHQKTQVKPGFSRSCQSVTPLHPAPRLAGCDIVTVPGTPSGSVPLGAGDPLGASDPLGAVIRWVFGHPGQPGQRQPSRGEGGPAGGRSRWRRDHEHFYFFQRHTKTQKHLSPRSPTIL